MNASLLAALGDAERLLVAGTDRDNLTARAGTLANGGPAAGQAGQPVSLAAARRRPRRFQLSGTVTAAFCFG